MGSLQIPASPPYASCFYLLQELKLIWDEVGKDQQDRERVLNEIEQECLEVYKKKVDRANIYRAQMHQKLADSEAELTNILIVMGERSIMNREQQAKLVGSLKEQLAIVMPFLQEMQLRKEVRIKQFMEVQADIQKISSEIAGNEEESTFIVNESDLSIKKLEEYEHELQNLCKEKSERLLKVKEHTDSLHELAALMGMDVTKIISEIHPNMIINSHNQYPRNISDNILQGLASAVELLREEKQRRVEKLQLLGEALENLWNLTDTDHKERQQFTHIINFSSPNSSIVTHPGGLTLDMIIKVETEVERLNQQKASKMKELFLKKMAELQFLCRRNHMEKPSSTEMENMITLITSGEMKHAILLKTIEELISKAEEEAFSRKDILDKVEKWIALCNEECWLEEYERDENRYSTKRGGHKDLRRAEQARKAVQKIPALVDLLMTKTNNWELFRNKTFTYDKVPLLEMLEQYNLSRNEQGEKQMKRERKRQGHRDLEEISSTRPNTSRSSTSSFSITRSSSNRMILKGINSREENKAQIRRRTMQFNRASPSMTTRTF